MKNLKIKLARTLNGKYSAVITFVTIVISLIAITIALNLALKNVELKEKTNKLENVNLKLQDKIELSDFEYSLAASNYQKEIDSLETKLKNVGKTKVIYINTLERDGILFNHKGNKVLDLNKLNRYMRKKDWLPGFYGDIYAKIVYRCYEKYNITPYID